jgi:hypothetical protein
VLWREQKRRMQGMIRIGVKLTMILCIWLLEVTVYGGYEDPVAKTNINPKTDFFEKEIEDYGAFESRMGSLKAQAVEGINIPGNLELITDKTDDEIKAAASDLSTIRATDLEARGREEVLRTGMTELHVDYTNPLNTEHQKDAVSIAEASGVLLGKLTELFKEFGIDCQTVKGNTVIEPEYHIEIKKEQVKDTVYTKTMCEEPRNKYNCHDSLTLRCARRGIASGAWQNRTMIMTFVTIPERWWTVGRYENSICACGRWSINPAYNQEIAIHIAGTIGAKLDQVYVGHQNIVVIPRPNLSTNVDWSDCGERWGEFYSDQRWAKITFHYQYKPNYEVCEQWTEDWREVCILQ